MVEGQAFRLYEYRRERHEFKHDEESNRQKLEIFDLPDNLCSRQEVAKRKHSVRYSFAAPKSPSLAACTELVTTKRNARKFISPYTRSISD